MKILIISTVKYRKNGISSVIKNYYTNKAFADCDLSFLFPDGSDAGMVKELEGQGRQVYLRSRSMKRALAYCTDLAKLIRKEGFDMIHVHGNSATIALEMIAAWLGGCKVRIAHSHNTTCKHMTVHKLFSPVFQKLCTHRLACGMDAGKWLYGEREFTVVNNGVDTRRFAFDPNARNRIRQQYGIEDNTVLIGHVGLFNEQKNQSFLIDVLKALETKDYRLMLMGDGELRAAVQEKAERLGLSDRIIFTGVISDVPGYLSACDCIAMPSFYEGLPLALIEEQACGLQCVVSEHVTEEVDKTGYLKFLPLEDAGRWADAICALPKADRMELSRMGAHKISQCGYDIHTEAARLMEYYKQAEKRKL